MVGKIRLECNDFKRNLWFCFISLLIMMLRRQGKGADLRTKQLLRQNGFEKLNLKQHQISTSPLTDEATSYI